jgi:thioredoxin-like negative regulator of GroEL
MADARAACRRVACGSIETASENGARFIVANPALPASQSEAEWLERGRALVLRGDLDGALAVFADAYAEQPASIDIALALAGVLWQAKQADRAEAVLRPLLSAHPTHVAATFLLAKILKEQARANAVAATVRTLFAAAPQPVGATIQAVELLDDAGRKRDAANLCEAAIAEGSTDPRLYA